MMTPGSSAPARPGDSPSAAPGAGGTPAGDGLRPGSIVIAPAHPAPRDGHPDLVFELREGADAMAVLPVFSSVRRLVLALGQAQPWVALPLLRVRELAAAGGVSTVVVDPEVASGAWRWGYRDLERLEQGLDLEQGLEGSTR